MTVAENAEPGKTAATKITSIAERPIDNRNNVDESERGTIKKLPANFHEVEDRMSLNRPPASGGTSLCCARHMVPGEPLWKRVPTRDLDGSLLSDFMMLIPKLGQQPRSIIEEKIAQLNVVLQCYERRVVFADLNLKLNVLWVSVRPSPGICLELATAIKACLPEAMLVAHQQPKP